MPYFLIPDEHDDDPIWDALAGDSAIFRDRLQAGWARLGAVASHARTDGYLTEQEVRRRCIPKVVDALCTPVLGRAPRLHRPGDKCACLDEVWVAGYGYRLHRFLKRNPSRAETDRQRERRADLADPVVKHRVRVRDGDTCRYCGSGPLTTKAVRAKDRRKVLTFDHVDPDRPAGADLENLVCCCARCNEHKGRRTPEEADMTLLPVPTRDQAVALATRDRVLLDLPEQQTPITARSTTNQRSDVDSTSDPTSDQDREPTQAEIAEWLAGGDNLPASYPFEQRPNTGRQGSGLGRGGQPDRDREGLPQRSPAGPDPYTRRARYLGSHDQATSRPAGTNPDTPETPPRPRHLDQRAGIQKADEQDPGSRRDPDGSP